MEATNGVTVNWNNARRSTNIVIPHETIDSHGFFKRKKEHKSTSQVNLSGEFTIWDAAIETMKALRYYRITLMAFIYVLFTVSFGQAQERGTIWIGEFEPGSSMLTDPNINKHTLALFDSLATDSSITFDLLGASDELDWFWEGHKIAPEIAEAWNDAKRLSRARVLRERIGRGLCGITHEFRRAVLVQWERQTKTVQEPVTLPLAVNGQDTTVIVNERFGNGYLSGKNERKDFLLIGVSLVFPNTAPRLFGEVVDWKSQTFELSGSFNANFGNTPVYVGLGYSYRKENTNELRYGITETMHSLTAPFRYAQGNLYLSIVPKAVNHLMQIDGTGHGSWRFAFAFEPLYRIGNFMVGGQINVMPVQLMASPSPIEYNDNSIGITVGYMVRQF